MGRGLTRREFIQQGAAGALVLGLSRLSWAAETADGVPILTPVTYTDWRDVYRGRWTWDSIARGTHTNTNCLAACAWNLYVREGIVWREEQVAGYAAASPSVPDFNPRGCNKGACASDLFTGPARITHPLRRVGPRGSGRWKRVSWDEALEEIAGKVIDELVQRGGKGVICEMGPNIGQGPNTAAPMRFFRMIGAPMTDSNAMIGDLPVGATITLGTPHVEGSADDWFRSDYLVIWAFNPVVARIPDAHFVTETRYRGGRVVVVAPDYNQSALRADLWLGVKPGSDAALALGACQVILEEKLFDADYIREQTDLPFLVRTDTQRFVRESDIHEGGSDTRFAVWDESTDSMVWAPGSEGEERETLRWGAVVPSLDLGEGREVALASGDRAPVETVLGLLRRQLDSAQRPEQVASITGLSADTIRRFARDFAGAGAALILSQFGMCKNYHSDLMQRSQILLASLTGNLGRDGGGWRCGGFIPLDGFAVLGMQEDLSLASLAMTQVQQMLWPEELLDRFKKGWVPSTVFHAVHGGLGDISTRPEYGEPGVDAAAFLREAVDNGHFPVGPGPDEDPPSVIFSIFGSVLRHARAYQHVREKLFDPARLVVDINFRVSETGRQADIILPAASWYEKIGLKYIVNYVPYVTLGDRAVPPRGESKPEWEIFSLLASRVADVARQRGVAEVSTWHDEPTDLATLDTRFSDGGRFGPDDQEAALEFILLYSGPTNPMAGLPDPRRITLDDLREHGAMRVVSLGLEGGMSGIFSEFPDDGPIVPFRDFTIRKRPYPTLTGRQQFYIDHPWFLQLGEGLPTHKDPPAVGGDHPLILTGGHTRWSIHAQWRDQQHMLKLQRGEPVVYLSIEDCDARGIGDHDRIRVRNDVGAFIARAKPTPAIQPGQAHIYHAWEPYQFEGQVSHQALMPSPIKVTQLVGDYGQLHWNYAHYEPNQVDRDTRVEVERLDGPAPKGA